MASAPLSIPRSRTLPTLRRWARALLDESDVNYSPKEIDWMFMEASGCSAVSLITEAGQEASADAAETFHRFIQRRAAGEPVQYILGHTEFYALSIVVNPSVLIPRPETEGLVDRALEFIGHHPEIRVLDIGTGSGCIAVALAANAPGLSITGIDVSQDALEVARLNGFNHGLDIEWRCADYENIKSFERLGGPFGLIVSNPPYVSIDEFEALDPEVRIYEPRRALTPGEEKTGPYRRIAILARKFLNPDGLLLVEINEKLGREVCRIFENQGLKQVELQVDLAGRDRYVLARV